MNLLDLTIQRRGTAFDIDTALDGLSV